MNRRDAMERIVVVGGGLTGLCAAIGFARALPKAEVTLAAIPVDPAALADRLPAVAPQVAETFEALGVDEATLVAAGAATHRVGERFAWGDAPFVIGEGEGVPSLSGAALHQLWLAHGEGSFGAMIPGVALATAERFVPPSGDTRSLLSCFDYALRLDPERAVPVFGQAARDAGVRIVATSKVTISPSENGVAAIRTGEGMTLTADLFIDATGPAALLAPPQAGWVDWSTTIGVDRLLLGQAPPRPSPLDTYDAHALGWSARWPLTTRTLTGLAYRAAASSEARIRKQMPGAAERITIQPRRRVVPFAGNVLALGDAAAAVGPLGWMGLTLALAQLELALTLMPARQPEPLLVAEYNRRATLRADRVHAYCSAFSLAGPGRSGDFWHPLRRTVADGELAVALAQFGQRGTLPPIEEEMIAEAQWQQALIGLGVRPARRDPVALSTPRVSAVAALSRLRQAVAELPRDMPAYPDYLAMTMRGRR